MTRDTRRRNALDRLRQLHEAVDLRARALEQRHATRIRCEVGCHGCCVDQLSVFEVEAERIRRSHPDLLARSLPHAEGACAFLDDAGACRVYDARPYVCRTQGLPLRWVETDDAGGAVEFRDICPLNESPGPAVEQLAEEDCWTIGETESRLRQLQIEFGGELRRVLLRDLF